jgi:hypothetical protein
VAKAFKLNSRVVYVKSVEDYEEAPEGGETLIFREGEPEEEEIEEVLRADRAFLNDLAGLLFE